VAPPRPPADRRQLNARSAIAAPITKREIKALPRIDYEAARASLCTGDLVFCSGSYLFSRLIQRFTRSVWSHVGIVYRDEQLQRVFVLESETGIGVRLVPLSKYLRDYHGRRRPYRGEIVVARLQPLPERPALERAINFGLDELTRPYDNGEILRIAARIMFRIGRRTRDRKYICSELVHECCRQAGISLRLQDNFVSPIDLWRAPGVVPLHRIL
jgi:cell wall-associated NlpC family hydrolase